MEIFIKGVKINSLNVGFKEGQEEIQGNYSLMSSIDKVLAKDNFNGYSDIKVAFSPKTLASFNAFLTGVKEDLSMVVLGTIEGGK